MTKIRNKHLIGLMIGVAAIALATPASAQTRQDRLSARQRARKCMFERGVSGD
jgi:hypothetical protein